MNKQIDLIVTHYNEPWTLGKPFFDMLEHQQCFDRSLVDVTLVQDGAENALPWNDLLSGYSFSTRIITLPRHSGAAAARNTAIAKSEADWLMFCNFDDMLGDVSAMSVALAVMPTDECDVIWCKLAKETKWFTGITYINTVTEANFVNTDGKLYRRQHLLDKSIMFPLEPEMYYDVMFNNIVLTETPPHRIKELISDFYPYFKTFRPDSFRHTLYAIDRKLQTAMQRDVVIAEELRNRGFHFEYIRSIAKAVCREFYLTYETDSPAGRPQHSPGFLDFYRHYRSDFKQLSYADMEAVRSEAEIETMNLIQNVYNEHKRELYFVNDDISFPEWLDRLDADAEHEQDDVAPATAQKAENDGYEFTTIDNSPVVVDTAKTQPERSVEREQRIVVYCGTYDVYLNMVASCKSLLCNTPVDRVYFLTEDDVFPYELPDIVTNINVSGQQYFPHDGPNYDNSWTWMCMIRAAFPELFPQYSRILSLDIDVVITEDVSDLWDYDLSGYYLAGVPERQRQHSASDPAYINFGVVMMNLDALRSDNKQQEIIEILNTRRVDCPEQGAYNTVCAWHILELPADYNYTAYSHITGDAVRQRIIHYAGQKFWRHYANVKQYADLGWNEVMRRQNALKGANNNAT